MKLIKLGLISLVAFALLITFISFFFPSHVRISRAVDIQAPKDSVWNRIKDPARWREWYPGGDSLPVIYVYAKAAGIGIKDEKGLLLKDITDSTVTAEEFGAARSRTTSGWQCYEGYRPGTVTIQWFMDFRLRWYPWEKFSSLLLDKRFGTMMESGLEKLQQVATKK